MKKILILTLLISLFINSFSQIAVYKVTDGDALQTIPRVSIDIGIPINIIGPWSIIKAGMVYTESGLFFTNNGLIYDTDDLRYIHRTIGLSVPIRVGGIIKENYFLGVGFNFNFPFHYRLKTFDVGTRQNKEIAVSEFFSKRVTNFYPSAEVSAGISLHGIGRFSIRLQMFPANFFNTAYTETVEGYELESKPYEGIVIERNFRILLSYSPGL